MSDLHRDFHQMLRQMNSGARTSAGSTDQGHGLNTSAPDVSGGLSSTAALSASELSRGAAPAINKTVVPGNAFLPKASEEATLKPTLETTAKVSLEASLKSIPKPSLEATPKAALEAMSKASQAVTSKASQVANPEATPNAISTAIEEAVKNTGGRPPVGAFRQEPGVANFDADASSILIGSKTRTGKAADKDTSVGTKINGRENAKEAVTKKSTRGNAPLHAASTIPLRVVSAPITSSLLVGKSTPPSVSPASEAPAQGNGYSFNAREAENFVMARESSGPQGPSLDSFSEVTEAISPAIAQLAPSRFTVSSTRAVPTSGATAPARSAAVSAAVSAAASAAVSVTPANFLESASPAVATATNFPSPDRFISAAIPTSDAPTSDAVSTAISPTPPSANAIATPLEITSFVFPGSPATLSSLVGTAAAASTHPDPSISAAKPTSDTSASDTSASDVPTLDAVSAAAISPALPSADAMATPPEITSFVFPSDPATLSSLVGSAAIASAHRAAAVQAKLPAEAFPAAGDLRFTTTLATARATAGATAMVPAAVSATIPATVSAPMPILPHAFSTVASSTLPASVVPASMVPASISAAKPAAKALAAATGKAARTAASAPTGSGYETSQFKIAQPVSDTHSPELGERIVMGKSAVDDSALGSGNGYANESADEFSSHLETGRNDHTRPVAGSPRDNSTDTMDKNTAPASALDHDSSVAFAPSALNTHASSLQPASVLPIAALAPSSVAAGGTEPLAASVASSVVPAPNSAPVSAHAQPQIQSNPIPDPPRMVDSGRLQVSANHSELKISVQVPELGKVEVRAVTSHDVTTAHVTASGHDAYQILAAGRMGLEQVLKTRDVVLSSFGSNAQGQSAGQQRQQNFQSSAQSSGGTSSIAAAEPISVVEAGNNGFLPDYSSISVRA
jgi:hypothetical protein